MGRLLWRKTDRKWEYTLAETAREEVGFQRMEYYIIQRQNTVAQYNATRLLLELYEGAYRSPGSQGEQWWYQEDINI